MSQINRVPQGLQDLLGSQNFGDNPSELGSVVAPTLDLERLLFAERRWFSYKLAANVAVDGSFNVHTVPAGELWLVENCAVGVTLAGVGGSWQGVFGVSATQLTNVDTAGALSVPVAGLGQLNANAGAIIGTGQAVFSHSFPKPLPFYPGEQIGFHLVNGLYAGGQLYTIRSSVQFIKAKI